MNNSPKPLLKWQEHPNNPLIESPGFLFNMLADPTFLTPDQTPDGLWHLYSHRVLRDFSLFSLVHFVSSDGIHWSIRTGEHFRWCMRPFLFKEEGRYYLLYERVQQYWPVYHSRIEMQASDDLKHWSRANVLLSPTLSWHREGTAGGSVSNPCMVRHAGKYRLYYSAGLVRLEDCGFDEPKYIGCAQSERIEGPFTPMDRPVIAPDPGDPYLNLGAGCMKVVAYGEGYLAFQNGIYWNEAIAHSGSAIRVWQSPDGLEWSVAAHQPILAPEGKGWKASHVYANDVRFYQGRWIMYFNAREGWWIFEGKEKIGRADHLEM